MQEILGAGKDKDVGSDVFGGLSLREKLLWTGGNMGEKDKAERMLENFADVFADIVNVLMFGGKRLISPDELVEVDARSQFKAESGKLHEQERDCARLWRRDGRTLALLGLENQTDIDEDMPY